MTTTVNTHVTRKHSLHIKPLPDTGGNICPRAPLYTAHHHSQSMIYINYIYLPYRHATNTPGEKFKGSANIVRVNQINDSRSCASSVARARLRGGVAFRVPPTSSYQRAHRFQFCTLQRFKTNHQQETPEWRGRDTLYITHTRFSSPSRVMEHQKNVVQIFAFIACAAVQR